MPVGDADDQSWLLCAIVVQVHGAWVYSSRSEEEYCVLEFDTSWIGKEFDRYTYQVTKE